MEPTEMQEFSKQLKESAETGAERAEEPLTTISLAVSILAVLVAMVTVVGHRTHTEAVLAQARAGDTWNEYQARRIRFDQAGVAIDLLSLQPNSNAAAVEEKVSSLRAQQAKWQAEISEDMKKAHEFEEDVERAERRALRYDLGEALLQISVVMCSITLFTRRKMYFFGGLAVGFAGILCAVTALLVR